MERQRAGYGKHIAHLLCLHFKNRSFFMLYFIGPKKKIVQDLLCMETTLCKTTLCKIRRIFIKFTVFDIKWKWTWPHNTFVIGMAIFNRLTDYSVGTMVIGCKIRKVCIKFYLQNFESTLKDDISMKIWLYIHDCNHLENCDYSKCSNVSDSIYL